MHIIIQWFLYSFNLTILIAGMRANTEYDLKNIALSTLSWLKYWFYKYVNIN